MATYLDRVAETHVALPAFGRVAVACPSRLV